MTAAGPRSPHRLRSEKACCEAEGRGFDSPHLHRFFCHCDGPRLRYRFATRRSASYGAPRSTREPRKARHCDGPRLRYRFATRRSASDGAPRSTREPRKARHCDGPRLRYRFATRRSASDGAPRSTREPWKPAGHVGPGFERRPDVGLFAEQLLDADQETLVTELADHVGPRPGWQPMTNPGTDTPIQRRRGEQRRQSKFTIDTAGTARTY
jgi:hypothetical protein